MELIYKEDICSADICSDIDCEKCSFFQKDATCLLRKRVFELKTVDAVPVVRCENCVCYREPDEEHAYCTNHLRETEADDYCSYGIRKDWESND